MSLISSIKGINYKVPFKAKELIHEETIRMMEMQPDTISESYALI